MARTPLMHALQQLVSEQSEALDRGVPIEQVREERQVQISRRRLLKGAGALALSAAAAPFLPTIHIARAASRHTHTPRIGIVGAGIAGLHAALTLQDAGLPSTIFEATSRFGGHMHSNTSTWTGDQKSEWCGEFIDSNHTVIRSLVERFNLPTLDRKKSHIPGSQDTYYFSDAYYLPEQAADDFKPVYPILQQQLKDAGYPTLYNHYTKTGYFLDHISAYDWIERYIPGGHHSNFGRLIDVAYNIEYGLDTTAQSSLNILYLLAYQPKHNGLSLFGTSDERYSILSGNQQLPLAIANTLPAGAIKLNSRLTTIVRNQDQTITLTFNTPSGAQQSTFDYVILTIPFSILRALDYSRAGFDHLKRIAIAQLGYGTNSKLALQFDTRYWNGRGKWPNISTGAIYTDLRFQTTWDSTLGQQGATGILVNFTGGSAGKSYKPDTPYSTSQNSEQVRRYAADLLRQIEIVWPGVSAHYNGRAALSYPTGDPHILGSYACWLVGQYTLFSGYERKAQGNMLFAGEHTSVNFQGYMEGGARSGLNAANAIIKKSGSAPLLTFNQ